MGWLRPPEDGRGPMRMTVLKNQRRSHLRRVMTQKTGFWLLCAGLLVGTETTQAVAQQKPAGTSGSAYEPWQEGGLSDGATTAPTLATTIEAMPRNLPRTEGPGLEVSIAAASAAVAACKAEGVNISVLVADAVGEPVVLLSGDGAGVRSQLITRTKANIVVRFGRASGEVAEAAKTNPALSAQAAADPAIGVLRSGAFPVLRDGRMIGVVAVSGGSLGGDFTLDDKCAREALAVLEGAVG